MAESALAVSPEGTIRIRCLLPAGREHAILERAREDLAWQSSIQVSMTVYKSDRYLLVRGWLDTAPGAQPPMVQGGMLLTEIGQMLQDFGCRPGMSNTSIKVDQ